MVAIALLEKIKKPTDAELDEAMTGNICRCNTYHRIKTAVRDAAGRLASSSE
jgi:aerobic-type carbon monoxide dehydrogenase small subunit (CoxS/CutS family)